MLTTSYRAASFSANSGNWPWKPVSTQPRRSAPATPSPMSRPSNRVSGQRARATLQKWPCPVPTSSQEAGACSVYGRSISARLR